MNIQTQWWLLLICLIPFSAWAQGIQFEEGSWKEVVEKAKSQNKLIYLDVYASWCGPCKMMAQHVFPTEEAGKKYNELFVNYKVDAEKGEGRTIAQKYGVSSYPTNLYINPHDESVVYRVAGACGVPEFLARADIAQQDFKDPLTWEQYEERLTKNPKDAEFLMRYIGKAGRLGHNNDKAIDIYVQHHMSIPPTDSNIYFLVMNTHTFDNKGYQILLANKDRVNAMIADPRQKFEEREKTYYFQETFKKAVALKDPKVLYSVKPVLNKYNPLDSTGRWYWLQKLYYTTVQDSIELTRVNREAIQYYKTFSEKDRQQRDSLLYAAQVANLQATARNPKQLEAQLVQFSKNPTVTNTFTYNIVCAYEAGIEDILKLPKPGKKQLEEAVQWSNACLKIANPNFPNYENLVQQKAKLLYKSGKKSEAGNTMKNLIEELAAAKKPTTLSQKLLEQIENNTL